MEYRNIPTTCIYCGTGCGLYLEVLDGRVVGTYPDAGHPISEGHLCVKGWNAHGFVHHEARLKTPLIRKGGALVAATWDEALGLVASELRRIRDQHGPDALAFVSSAKATNEANYVFQKLARAVIGTNNVDHCARLCHSPSVAGLSVSFGSGAMSNSTPELEHAKCILVTGSNTTEGHPIIGARIMRAKEHGAKLIVVDPRDIQLARMADFHLRQRLGTDVAWINGMIHVILAEGLEDKLFIAERTEGIEELRQAVAEYTPARVEEITGIPAADLVAAARAYATSGSSAIVYAMGITQHSTGTDNVMSLANLAMVTGNIGRPNCGVNPLRGQNNVQGACDVGGLPDVYPGYQRVTDEKMRQKFLELWGAAPPAQAGLTVTEMVDAAGTGAVRGMYIMGENPVLSEPNVEHAREALARLEFLVVQDIFPVETTEWAHVVLPAASFAEIEGTFTTTDRRVQRVHQAIAPIGQSRPDWEIICDLARRLGPPAGPLGGFDYQSPADIMDEIAKVTPIYGGVNYGRLDALGFLQWPCRTPEDPGTPYLHKGQFSRGKGKFVAVPYRPPAEQADSDYPMMLTTGRHMFHWHTGSMTRRTAKLSKEVPEGYVEINPQDAERLHIGKSQMVRLVSRRGQVEARAWITRRVPAGTVFMPFHFAESAANRLTNGALDPIAKIPEYKVCAVRVEKAA
jgi:formate dehydrogenase alpha subunit